MSSHETTTSEAPHEHPNYVAIWAALLVLLGISIALGHIGNVVTMNVLVFGIAAIKIGLVTRYFMHVKMEPWLITILLVGAFLCLVALFIGTAMDISWRTGWNGR